MKTIIFVFFQFLLLSSFVYGQTIHWEENFPGNTVSNRIKLINDNTAKITQDNNTLKLELTKDSLYQYLVYKPDTLDIAANPFVSVKVRSTNLVDMYVNFLDDNLSRRPGNASYHIIKSDSIFTYYTFDLSLLYNANIPESSKINPKKVSAILIHFERYHESNLTVELADLKIGSTAISQTSAKGYKSDFNSLDNKFLFVSEQNQSKDFKPSQIVTQSNGELKIDIDKTMWNGLWVSPGYNSYIDFSANKQISIRAKASRSGVLRIYLWDYQNLYLGAFADVYIVKSEIYKTYIFNYTDKFFHPLYNGNEIVGTLPLDSTRIKAMLFNFNPGENYKGTVTIDEITVGDQVLPYTNKAPLINQVSDVNVAKNASSQQISLNGIGYGDTLGYQGLNVSVSATDTNLIKDLVVFYSDGNDDANLLFTPAPDKTGSTMIYVKVKDDGGTLHGGVDSTVISFKVNVGSPTSAVKSNQITNWYIYPNPVENVINFQSIGNIEKCIIQNVQGVEVLEINNNITNQINVSALSKGIFTLKIYTSEGLFFHKFVK